MCTWVRLLFPLLALFAGAGCLRAAIPPNLMPNGSLENGLAGWTPGQGAALDATQGKDDAQSLKLTFTPGKRADATSPRAPVEAGKDYLVLLWFRSEGYSRPGKYDVSSTYTPVWYDAQGKALPVTGGNSFPYEARGNWTRWPRLWTAPANAVALGLQFALYGRADSQTSSQWIDRISVRRLDGDVKPGGKRWTFYIPDHWFSGNFRVAADDDAFQGSAVLANPKFTNDRGYLAGNIYHKGLPPGQYRALFHLKIADVSGAAPVITLDTNSEKHCGVNGRAVLPGEFKQANVYQEFALRFIVTPQTGWVDWRAHWNGGVPAWIDTITVVEEEIYSEEQSKALFD
ncbi:MAG: hypothetical protein ACYC7E_17690 [Armatimonadota bacterium]